MRTQETRMPLPEPKGGVMRMPADTTAGKRGLPARLAQGDGTEKMPSKGSPREDHGQDLLSSNVRGGNTDGVMYESRLRRQTPSSGDGTGQ